MYINKILYIILNLIYINLSTYINIYFYYVITSFVIIIMIIIVSWE